MAGSIVEKGKNKFMVRVYTGITAEGKRKYHSKTINGSQKDAQKYLNKVLREKDTGEFIEPSKEYFGVYIDNWLKNTAKPRITDKTYRSYEQMVRLYLKPALADYKLVRITPENIQKLYNELIEKELSPRTVRYAHTVLRSALQQADKWGKINRNPADLVDLPKAERNETKALSKDDAAKFLKAAIYSRLNAMFTLMLTSGIRPGEAMGLRWQDLDFENNRITINRALTRSGKGWKLDEPKTARSRRTIPILEPTKGIEPPTC
jgi:integrase